MNLILKNAFVLVLVPFLALAAPALTILGTSGQPDARSLYFVLPFQLDAAGDRFVRHSGIKEIGLMGSPFLRLIEVPPGRHETVRAHLGMLLPAGKLAEFCSVDNSLAGGLT